MTTPGKSTTEHPLWSRWYHMVRRCSDPSAKSYTDYGGRGIRVCERWSRFEHFRDDILASIGLPPTQHHQLDRADNDGNYTPGNVRWATAQEQARNRRSSRIVECRGERLTLAEWAERLGVKSSLLWHRLAVGWSTEDALTPGRNTFYRGRRTLSAAQRETPPVSAQMTSALSVLNRDDCHTTAQVGQALGISSHNAANVLARLLRTGLVQRSTRGKVYEWRLSS